MNPWFVYDDSLDYLFWSSKNEWIYFWCENYKQLEIWKLYSFNCLNRSQLVALTKTLLNLRPHNSDFWWVSIYLWYMGRFSANFRTLAIPTYVVCTITPTLINDGDKFIHYLLFLNILYQLPFFATIYTLYI